MEKKEIRKVFNVCGKVVYAPDSIVSSEIVHASKGSVTLFAFDKGQALSEHTAPFDALLQVLEGKAAVTVAGEEYGVCAGEMIVMPANVPHAVRADERFKMMLTMIRE